MDRTPIPREAEELAVELWHACWPGTAHPEEGTADWAAYLAEALDELGDPGEVHLFGKADEVRALLEGGGAVRCGVAEHERGGWQCKEGHTHPRGGPLIDMDDARVLDDARGRGTGAEGLELVPGVRTREGAIRFIEAARMYGVVVVPVGLP